MRFDRVILVVLDSVGIGELPDAAQFGDAGSHTLRHIVERVPNIQLPNLTQLGLGHIDPSIGLLTSDLPRAHYGKMAEQSVGKDTMTGHWELMGLHVTIPFATYPQGFPEALIEQFEAATGRKVICNKPGSGTDVIAEYGEEQMKTGAWIVYTSADSVFQLAAHEDIIPLHELYEACEIARKLTLQPEFAVGRVIARPYVGEPGEFTRTSNRRDYAVKPPQPTVLNHLQNSGYAVTSVGKIIDIFSGEGITAARKTASNAEGIEQTIAVLSDDFKGLVFTNLVDFDSLYGHRRDPEGYARALEAFDARLPDIMDQMKDSDLLILTADHGNDPTHEGTDHTREYVPLLVYHRGIEAGRDIGVRSTFADVGATIAHNFNVSSPEHGISFLEFIK